MHLINQLRFFFLTFFKLKSYLNVNYIIKKRNWKRRKFRELNMQNLSHYVHIKLVSEIVSDVDNVEILILFKLQDGLNKKYKTSGSVTKKSLNS